MKKLLMITISMLAASLSLAQDTTPREWPNQVQCDIDISYTDLTAADISQPARAQKSVLIDLDVKKEKGYSFKSFQVDVPEVQSSITFAPLFNNYDYGTGLPSKLKKLSVSYAMVIEGQKYGSVMSPGTKANDTELTLTNQFSLMSNDQLSLQSYYDAADKDKKPTLQDEMAALFAGRKFVVRSVSAICSASALPRTAVTPRF